MSKGPRKNKGVVDKSESSEKAIKSNSSSWIADLEAKQNATVATESPEKVEAKVEPTVKKEKKSPNRRQSHHTGHSCMRSSVCVESNGVVIRMKRSTAEKLVREGKAKFVPRSVWKAANRQSAPVEVVAEFDPVQRKKAKRKEK